MTNYACDGTQDPNGSDQEDTEQTSTSNPATRLARGRESKPDGCISARVTACSRVRSDRFRPSPASWRSMR